MNSSATISRRLPPTGDEPEIEVSVVMPCLNEAGTVGKCIDKALAALQGLGVPGEVIVADNGSTDNSPGIARAHGARVVFVNPHGYGLALQGGIEAARGHYVIIGDADDSYDFRQLDTFVARLRAGDDLVLGNRFRGGIRPGAMPWLHRRIGNPLLTGILNLLFQTPVGDAHCGLRAFRKDSYRRLGLASPGMEFASEMVVKAVLQQQKISEIPIILHTDGRNGPSHLRTFSDGWRHLRLLLQLCPRRLYLLVALLLLATGFAFVGCCTSNLPAADAAIMPLWFLTNGFLFTAAWNWARRFFPEDGYLELIQHSTVLSWAGIVAVATALGATAVLKGPLLLAGVMILSLIALTMIRVRPGHPRLDPVPLDRSDLPWLALWAGMLAFSVAHVVMQGLLQFPTDWDSLAYHLPLVDQWLQAGSLYATQNSRWANPGNNELLALWWVAPFSGDFLVSLTNLPATILLACGSVALARWIGLPRPLAHLSGFAIVCHFVVLKQLVDTENDVAVAGCFFAVLSYIVRYHENSETGPLLLGAICLGLLTGVKYYALGYALLAFLLWLLLSTRHHRVRPFVSVLVAGAAGMITLGGFWYIRNWMLTGSPLYPKEFFKHPDLLLQIYPEVARTSFFGNGRPELLGLYIEAIWQRTGPCQLVAFLLTPLSLAWSIGTAGWYACRLGQPAKGLKRGVMGVLLLGTGVLLGMTPMAVEDIPGTLNQMRGYYCPVRYGLCFLSIATLAAMLLLRDAGFSRGGPEKAAHDEQRRSVTGLMLGGLRLLAYLVLGGAILFQLTWASHRLCIDWVGDLLLAGQFILGGLIGLLLKDIWPRRLPRSAVMLLVGVLPVLSWACARLSDGWHTRFLHFYERTDASVGLYEIEGRKAGPARILVLQPRCYAYFGSHRQNQVYQPVYVRSPEWLIGLLDKEHVDFVVATSIKPSVGIRGFEGIEECQRRYPNRFHLLKQGWDGSVLEVVPRWREVSTRTGDK